MQIIHFINTNLLLSFIYTICFAPSLFKKKAKIKIQSHKKINKINQILYQS